MQKQSSNIKYPLLLGSLTTAAGLGFILYQRYQNKSQNDYQIAKEQVIQILKEFKKEFYPIFKQLTTLSQKIQSDYKSKYNYVPEQVRDNLRTFLIDENPTFKTQITAMEDKVYSMYNIDDRKGFEAYVQKMAKIDPDVQTLVNDIKNSFRKAIQGQTVHEVIELSEKIDSDLVLEVYKDSLKQVLSKILEFVIEYKEKNGEINAYDQMFSIQLKNLNLEEIKLNILNERGFADDSENHPEKIFHFALAKYAKDSTAFKDKLQKLELFHQSLMQKLFTPGSDLPYLRTELAKIDKMIEPEIFEIKEEKMDEEKQVEDNNLNNEKLIEEKKTVEDKAIEDKPVEDKAIEDKPVEVVKEPVTQVELTDNKEVETPIEPTPLENKPLTNIVNEESDTKVQPPQDKQVENVENEQESILKIQTEQDIKKTEPEAQEEIKDDKKEEILEEENKEVTEPVSEPKMD